MICDVTGKDCDSAIENGRCRRNKSTYFIKGFSECPWGKRFEKVENKEKIANKKLKASESFI